MSDERANYRGIWGSHPPTNYGVKATQEESMTPSKDSPSAEKERPSVREALEFYAKPDNWRKRDHYTSPGQDFPAWREPSAVDRDNGAIARAALSSPSPDTSGDRGGGGWMPIETAPKDETIFLTHGEGRTFIAKGSILWHARRRPGTPAHLSMAYVTHWMPLPEPPR